MKNIFIYITFFVLCIMVGVLVILCAIEPSIFKNLALLLAFFQIALYLFVILDNKKN
jgi:hypothetical protein